jgi:hypothetical protein
MEPLSDDHIGLLLRLKRYEQPPPGYFENFLHEFRRRQRDELVRQPFWRVCFERAEAFALLIHIRSLAPAGIALLVASAAVFSIRLYQVPDTNQLAIQASSVPTRPPIMDKHLDFEPAPFEMQPALLPASTDFLLLPASDEPVPLNLEWESLEDQSPAGEMSTDWTN